MVGIGIKECVICAIAMICTSRITAHTASCAVAPMIVLIEISHAMCYNS